MQENNLKQPCTNKFDIINSDVSNDNKNVSSDNITMKTRKMDKNPSPKQSTKDQLGVTALIAIMEPATKSQSSRAHKQPLRSHPSNKIRVLLDSGSVGDLYFLPKGKDKPFPNLTRQAPKPWRTSNGSFQTNGRGKIRLKFFEYSASREYLIQPDIVQYEENHMTKPGFDLIILVVTP
jgi:hypothetical protein